MNNQEAPKRIQRKRTKDWRKPPNAVMITRPFIWGNPFPVNIYGEAAITMHKDWLDGKTAWPSLVKQREEVLRRLPELRGKNLACFCPEGSLCHGDDLLERANVKIPMHLSRIGGEDYLCGGQMIPGVASLVFDGSNLDFAQAKGDCEKCLRIAKKIYDQTT